MSDFTLNGKNTSIAVKAQVEKAAAYVLSQARRICPVDTGNLARSLTMREVASGFAAAYEVGTNVYYAPFVEFGTYKMRAQPYLGPALAAARARYG